MARLYAGTSGWAYASWKPDFYPPKLSPAKFLGYYAARLNSVELNYTFRRYPAEKMQAGWVGATPPGFQFAVKAHQSITHVQRLRDAAETASRFMAALQPLEQAGKLGPVLFQLPPFLKCDVPRLRDFLKNLAPGRRAAFEFRHPSWFCEEVFALLRQANAALCQAESEALVTPRVETANFVYLRLRQPHYSPKDLHALAERIRACSAGADVFAYFKHEETAEGALFAEALLRDLARSAETRPE